MRQRLVSLAVVSGVSASVLLLFAVVAQAQIPFVDSQDLAKTMGSAAEKSGAASVILGILACACLGFAAWSMRQRDATIAEMSSLRAIQTNVLNQITQIAETNKQAAESLRTMSAKPCALSHEELGYLIKGRFDKQ
jgi:hypothetical protein